MKTLINKANPQIRITAPEIERRKAMFYQDEHYCLIIKGLPWLDADDWTLVENGELSIEGLPWPEEEPTEDWREKRKKECPFRKADGCERYADVISECTGNCSWVVDYPKLKEIQDKKEQEQPEVDLEKEIKKHTDLFHADIEYPLRLTAIKFYELGRKGGSK